MTMARRSVSYGSEEISYGLTYASRKTLEISVYPNRQVVAVAPLGTPAEDVDKKIKKKARWIGKQKRFFEQFDPRTPPRQFVNGEAHLYLGKQYRLKIAQSTLKDVKLSGGYLWVYTHRPTCIRTIKELLDFWYIQRAHFKFQERLDVCLKKFPHVDQNDVRISMRRMSKRWGSMSKTGLMILNPNLIKAPVDCIDYVITHELCHLKFSDHSVKFYSYLESMMPDWRKRKLRLEKVLS